MLLQKLQCILYTREILYLISYQLFSCSRSLQVNGVSPCITYVQYRGGVQYRGRYHDACGGYLEYRGGYHDKCGDILSTVGDIMSTVEGYLEYRGDTQYR